MTRGRFLTLEGGEGVGKTSGLDCIRERLEQWGIDVIVTREPGGTSLGERLRELILGSYDVCPEAELLMIFAARVQHVRYVILPALAAGRWVLSDRFTDASYAYQGGGRGVPETTIRCLEERTLNSLEPDLTFLLDAPVDVGLARAQSRGAMDRFENEGKNFLDRVRRAYLGRAQRFPDRIVVIDAGHPADQVRFELVTQLQKRFGHEYQCRG